MEYQFNMRKIVQLSNRIDRYMLGKMTSDEIDTMQQEYKNIPTVSILLMMQQIFIDEENTKALELFIEHILQFDAYALYANLTFQHPIHVMIDENVYFNNIVDEIEICLADLHSNWNHEKQLEVVKRMEKIGNLYNHYHVKEKLFFPLIEQYGHVIMTRIIWREDDRIRGLYHGAKNMIERAYKSDPSHVMLKWKRFADAFRFMVFQEKMFLFPIATILFKEKEWEEIALECRAYGYEMVEEQEINQRIADGDSHWKTEDIPFGGGFLTIEEANLILNHLPVEITFVDRQSVFKYFNQVVDAADMMLIRTPLSIGRNVANCHPPKSLQKVMTLIRDLQTGRRKAESMWFKMKGAYVHITYKALFNETDEFVGILEYVQDIQPFFNLPKEVKRELLALHE